MANYLDQGVLHSGPITLSNTLPISLLNGSDADGEDESGFDRPRDARRGKMGIRNGFALDAED